MSTHMCDIKIDGLPFVLTSHIIPDLSIASMFGIRVLTEAGYEVTFDKNLFTAQCNGTIIFHILQGKKDVSTDLWTHPLGTLSTSTHHGAAMTLLVAPVISDAHAHHATTQIALFTHTVQNKANSIGISHQALCSPRISTSLKVIRHGYLKGCPNLTAHGVSKYLNPSPSTAKGHVKRPRQGIRSTRHVLTPATTQKFLQVPPIEPTGQKDVKLIPLDDVNSDYRFGFDHPPTRAAMI
jgi:hypothetical protein